MVPVHPIGLYRRRPERLERALGFGFELMTEGTRVHSAVVTADMNPMHKFSNRTERPWPVALLALLIALTLVGSACGGSASEDSGSEETDELDVATGSPTTTGAPQQGGDAAESSATDEDEEAATDMDTSDAMADAEGEEATESDGTARSTATVPDSADEVAGGFFAPAPPEEDPTESNTFKDYGVRPFVETDRDPFSTFALDVDTGAFTVGQQWLDNGQLPPRDSVRVEEYVNSFSYDYPAPSDGLAVMADGGPSPFDPDNVLVRLGVQAEEVSFDERPDANLTFIVDTSGSMDRHDRLGLVKDSLAILVNELDRRDSVAIVTYSDSAEVILPPTSASNRDEILDAIDSLQPDGSTNLEAGLYQGYDLANEAFIDGGINRVVLASDGVANVGLTDPDRLAETIRGDADRGIHLVTVGVGMGNFNDVVMEQLADQGDGFYAYVNDRAQAADLFGDDLVSTLLTVAIDGKIQVEFDVDTVEAYRLIGFENRAVLDQDFRNDEVDAGELGAGHQVTAIYELTLRSGVRSRDRLGTAQLRWEDPDNGQVIETRLELAANIIEDSWSATDEDFRLAVTVASLAEVLRDSPYAEDVSLDQILVEAEDLPARQTGPLVEMIRQAIELS